MYLYGAARTTRTCKAAGGPQRLQKPLDDADFDGIFIGEPEREMVHLKSGCGVQGVALGDFRTAI